MSFPRLEYECQNQSKQKRKLSCFITCNTLIKHKTCLLNLAEELGNISQACKIMGMSHDTFYVGNLKCVGSIYQQTFIDTYSKVAFAKLYTMKTAITATNMPNDEAPL